MIDSTIVKKQNVADNEQLSDETDSLAESYNRFLKDWKRYCKRQGKKRNNLLRCNYTFGTSFLRDK